MARRILVVDDEAEIRATLREFLEEEGFEVHEAESCHQAEDRFRQTLFDAVTLDYAMRDGNALQLLPRLRSIDASVPCILITGHDSVDLAVRAIKEGAEQVLIKPVELGVLQAVLERVIETHRLRRKALATESQDQPGPVDLFLGDSPQVRRLEEQARRAAASDLPVLLQGETGTGKSELARWLHRHSPRSAETMVDLNCAGLSGTFLETELFGHQKGAFTGAVAEKRGLFEVAHRGTVFLDEIGDMELAIQPKLLKVLEEKLFRRLGDVKERKVDVRFISATHQDLAQRVQQGHFRADLFYRVSAVPLRIPALRERPEDIPLLAQRLLDRLALSWRKGTTRLSPEAHRTLSTHPWPGNIRELKNVLERAAMSAAHEVLGPQDLDLSSAPAPAEERDEDHLTLREVERRHIQRILYQEGGHVERAARRLDIPRSTLYARIKALGIEPSRF